MNNKVLNIISKLEKSDHVIIEAEDKSYTLYYGYKSGTYSDNVPNPLQFCKGIIYIRIRGKEIEVFNNTGNKFESIKYVNQFNGFRNLIKELYERGFRVDEHKYDEEMLGYTSIEIIDSEYNNVFECVEKYNCFSNSSVLLNKEVFYTANKKINEKMEVDDYYRISNCIDFYETYENKEYLVIREFDKNDLCVKKYLSFDQQKYDELVENILIKCKMI